MRIPEGFVACSKDEQHMFGAGIAQKYKWACPVRGCDGKLHAPCRTCSKPTVGGRCSECETVEKLLPAYLASERGLERLRRILEEADEHELSLHAAMKLAILTWGNAFFVLGLGGPSFHADGTLSEEDIHQFGDIYQRVRKTCDDS